MGSVALYVLTHDDVARLLLPTVFDTGIVLCLARSCKTMRSFYFQPTLLLQWMPARSPCILHREEATGYEPTECLRDPCDPHAGA